MSTQQERLIALLQAKRRADPQGFREYLPGVIELLPALSARRRSTRSPFGLTERECAYHRDGLADALGKLAAKTVTAEEAVKGLQHCANLIRDDNLPEEVGYEVLKGLIRAALGKSPGSYRAKTIVPLGEGSGGPVLERVSAIRGVSLDLDRERRLVSISIHPGKVRERRQLMKFVGASKDPAPDVAAKHDDYLAMQARTGA